MKEIPGKKFYATLAGLICLAWLAYLIKGDTRLQVVDKKELLGSCIWALILITTSFSVAHLFSDLKLKHNNQKNSSEVK